MQGAYAATKTLLDAGYEKVGMISALDTSKPIKDRIKGYKLHLKILEKFSILV